MSLISGPDWSQCKPDDFTMASANIHPAIFARDSSHCMDVQKKVTITFIDSTFEMGKFATNSHQKRHV